MSKLGKKIWAAIIVFCLFGQFAWGIENMYFNLFVYNTITTDPTVIANMVFASALTATITTLFMGAWSDRLGKRKTFIVVGYILWGLSTMAFALISIENLQSLVGAAFAVQTAATLVIVMDCVMTFFGSTAYDAAFNAWVNDITVENQRGRVEGVLQAIPLLAIMIIIGGFDGLTRAGHWDIFFLIFGGLATLAGFIAIFLVKDSPSLKPVKSNYIQDVLHGFKPKIIKANSNLYITLCALGVVGISTQIALPYRIIYLQHYLKIENYAIIALIALLVAGIMSVMGGRWIDKIGKMTFIPASIVLNIIGLIYMYYARDIVSVILANILSMAGNMLVLAVLNALVRDYTPSDKSGAFQGIRMVFSVLIPMAIGPYIGAAVIQNSAEVYEELGVMKQVPTPPIFIASMVVLLFSFIPYLFLRKTYTEKVPKVVPGMLTKWGRTLDKENPLPEYPRPQMKRDNWQNLNGVWEYTISSNTATTIPEIFSGEIIVPFSPECLLSGVEKQLLPGQTLWYRRNITFQNAEKLPKILLHFGAVDQKCQVFLDGEKVGEHNGGYWPFSIDISSYVKNASHTLHVAVWDDTNTGIHAYGKQNLNRGWIWYTGQSGIWQTVWLEYLPETYIEALQINPLYDEGKIHFALASQGDFADCDISIYDNEKLIIHKTIQDKEIAIPIPDFKSWSPENPFLYKVLFKLQDDVVESYFGMRKFGKEKDENGHVRLTLNNKPFFHAGLLDQGYWSDGLYTPPSDEAMIWEISKVKELGFNMLRKHIKIEPMRWYYHCDRLGIIVWQDFVSGGTPYNRLITMVLPFVGCMLKDHHYSWFGRKNNSSRDQFEIDAEKTIALLRNVTSLAIWVPFNEGWGQFDAKRIAAKVKEADPSRLVDHASGWHDQGAGDFHSPHKYSLTYKLKKDTYGRINILSEYGGFGLDCKGHSATKKQFAYKKYANQQELTKAYEKLHQEEILPAIKQGLAASVYTQVSDVEDEINGLFTYDREVIKVDEKIVKKINKNITGK